MSIERGNIYFVNLNPTKGREQSGNRPVLVVSTDSINKLPLVVTVIVGTKGDNISNDYPTNVRVSSEESGLDIETVFMCFQVRSIDPQRFPKKAAGKLSLQAMQKVESALSYCLGL